jgi:hypothetical protein
MVLIVQLHKPADLGAGTNWAGGWEGPRICMEAMKKSKIFCPLLRVRPCLSSYIPYTIKCPECGVPRGVDAVECLLQIGRFGERRFLCYGPTVC